jgi:hypothetical protein
MHVSGARSCNSNEALTGPFVADTKKDWILEHVGLHMPCAAEVGELLQLRTVVDEQVQGSLFTRV